MQYLKSSFLRFACLMTLGLCSEIVAVSEPHIIIGLVNGKTYRNPLFYHQNWVFPLTKTWITKLVRNQWYCHDVKLVIDDRALVRPRSWCTVSPPRDALRCLCPADVPCIAMHRHPSPGSQSASMTLRAVCALPRRGRSRDSHLEMILGRSREIPIAWFSP